MAKGILVSYAGLPVMLSSFFPDNGLASLAGSLRAAGHEVKILDFNTVSTLAQLVPRERSQALAQLLPGAAGGKTVAVRMTAAAATVQSSSPAATKR